MKCSAALAVLLFAPLLRAEVESDIPFGLEVVTGIRSHYVYRGFELADTLIDVQLEGEVTLGKDLYLSLGGWVGTESGDDFQEVAGFLDLRHDVNDLLAVGLSATYHTYRNTFFDDGLDLGAFAKFYATEDLDFSFGAYRDFGAEGWYAKAESGWSIRLGEDSYFALTGGLSWVDDYYGRSGMNDFYGRAAVTYNINSSVSLTPFVGWSLEIDGDDGDGDEVLAGLWFAVVF